MLVLQEPIARPCLKHQSIVPPASTVQPTESTSMLSAQTALTVVIRQDSLKVALPATSVPVILQTMISILVVSPVEKVNIHQQIQILVKTATLVLSVKKLQEALTLVILKLKEVMNVLLAIIVR